MTSHVALKIKARKILRKFHISGLNIVLFVDFEIKILDLFYVSLILTMKEASEQLFP